MSVPSQIKDGKGTKKTLHLHEKRSDIGAIAYTHPLREYVTISTPFFNPDEGVDMAVNGAFGGTPDVIHIGISDGANWTGSNITGTKANFDSGDRANTGSYSVKVDNPNTNDVWEFDKGSDLTIPNYTAITMYINVDKDWTAGESLLFYAWDTGLGTQVGSSVRLEDYFDELNFDVWQKLVIPFADMALTTGTLDAFRMQMNGIKSGKNPKFYIDNLQAEETGDPIEFTVTPTNGTLFLMTELRLNFVDAYDGTLVNASMPNLSYNKILGETKLTNGINLTRTVDGVVDFSVSITQMNDLLVAGAYIESVISDGTNTSVMLVRRFDPPFVLDSRVKSYSSFVISDDLTGLISFTALAVGKEEQVGAGSGN